MPEPSAVARLVLQNRRPQCEAPAQVAYADLAALESMSYALKGGKWNDINAAAVSNRSTERRKKTRRKLRGG
jgi:hypothetical protein